MNKDTIKYLIELPPDKRLMAGMMFIILSLVSERTISEYNHTKYRNRKENQIIQMERDNASETIKYYNHLIDEENLKNSKIGEQQSRLIKMDSIITSLERRLSEKK